MNILIVGCGRVGVQLVRALETLGHDVSVVDENPALLARLTELSPPFTGMAVRGVAIDVDVLRSAGIEACDAVAAVTQDDNINVMVAQMAKEVFHVDNVIARVTDPSAKEIFSEQFGLRTICSTNLTTQAFVAGLLHEEENEKQCVLFGSTTVNFSMLPVTEKQLGMRLDSVCAPRPGLVPFAVWRSMDIVELDNKQSPILQTGDKIVFAAVAD
ncbi:MAG: TrkA family potassium uptake protein [Ruthenibacterium sp.]